MGSLTARRGGGALSWELDSGENPVYPRQADQPCYFAAGTGGALSIPQLKRWHYADTDGGWHDPLTFCCIGVYNLFSVTHSMLIIFLASIWFVSPFSYSSSNTYKFLVLI